MENCAQNIFFISPATLLLLLSGQTATGLSIRQSKPDYRHKENVTSAKSETAWLIFLGNKEGRNKNSWVFGYGSLPKLLSAWHSCVLRYAQDGAGRDNLSITV